MCSSLKKRFVAGALPASLIERMLSLVAPQQQAPSAPNAARPRESGDAELKTVSFAEFPLAPGMTEASG